MQCFQFLRTVPRCADRYKRHQYSAQLTLPLACTSRQQSHAPVTAAEHFHPQTALAPRGRSKQEDGFVVDALVGHGRLALLGNGGRGRLIVWLYFTKAGRGRLKILDGCRFAQQIIRRSSETAFSAFQTTFICFAARV